MVRTLIKIALTIAGNAIGLFVASLLLEDVNLNFSGFLIALIIFTVAELLIEPIIEKVFTTHAEKLRMFTSLVTTFLALLVTDLISDGLDIEGVSTWVLATIIVWLGTLLAGVILVRLFLENRRDGR
ncbi:MAG: phage holin family protein [Ilumatobacteraceae bacterium]